MCEISGHIKFFRSKSCFLDADGGRDHKLRIQMDECGVKEDSEGFLTQVLVIQLDDWLIFPGDTAFKMQCSAVWMESLSPA